MNAATLRLVVGLLVEKRPEKRRRETKKKKKKNLGERRYLLASAD